MAYNNINTIASAAKRIGNTITDRGAVGVVNDVANAEVQGAKDANSSIKGLAQGINSNVVQPYINNVQQGAKNLNTGIKNLAGNIAYGSNQRTQGANGNTGDLGNPNGVGDTYTPPSTTQPITPIDPSLQGASRSLGIPPANTYVAPIRPATISAPTLLGAVNPIQVANTIPSPQNVGLGEDRADSSQGPSNISQDETGLHFNTSTGQGSIKFGNKTLSPDTVNQLGRDIAYNSLQSTKDKFANEAAIVAQRHADYDAFKQNRDYLDNASSANPNQTLLHAQQTMATLGNHKDIANINATSDYNTSAIRQRMSAASDDSRQSIANENNNRQDIREAAKLGQGADLATSKLISTQGFNDLPLVARAGALRLNNNGTLGLNQFKALHTQDELDNALSSKDNIKAFLKQHSYPSSDQEQILSDYNSGYGTSRPGLGQTEDNQ